MKKRFLCLIFLLCLGFLTLTGCKTKTQHEHTYSNEWSNDETSHWHQDTCGHNLKNDEAEHTWNDGVEVTNGTKYICTICGYEKTEVSKVTDTTWKEAMTSTSNYTVNQTFTDGTTKISIVVYIAGNDVQMVQNNNGKTDKFIITKVEDKYYEYSFSNNEWVAHEISKDIYESIKGNFFEYFKNEYSKFTYDESANVYELKNLAVTESMVLKNIKIGFEGNKIVTFGADLMGGNETTKITCTNFGTTVVEIPTDVHEHTYSTEWSYDDNNHWHATTCGHEGGKDKDIHEFGGWVVMTPATEDAEGIEKATCTICGYEKTRKIDKLEHTHKYSDEWSHDEKNHWHASTCNHDVKSEEAEHVFVNGVCSVCGYSEYTITFKLASSGVEYEVAGFSGSGNNISLVIPSTYNNLPVTRIGQSAFINCKGLINVTIPEGVTSIGDRAFSTCSNLKTVIIPSSVKTIGAGAFKFCQVLTELTIPDTVASIGEEAFYFCRGLTSLTIGKGIKELPNRCFGSCTSLTSVTIPYGVLSIGNSAFGYCPLLESIIIPDSVTSIGVVAFENCSGLKSVEISNSVKSIGNKAFSGCTSLTDITIPSSVTSLGDEAFSGCTSLTNLIIGSGVESIGNSAFYMCSNLNNIEVNNENTKYHSSKNCLIETNTYTLILGCNNSVIPLDGSVVTILDNAFYNCTGLTTIEIPNSVTTISKKAFYNCTGLTDITIPNSVTTIGDSAFYGCTGLKSVIIGDNTSKVDSSTILGPRVFYGCTGLTNVSIGNNVTVIGTSAFSECNNITSINIGNRLETIENSAFANCGSITSIIIPDSVGKIGLNAFYNCKKLKEVYYAGDSSKWGNINIDSSSSLNLTTIYYYSETQPTVEGNYWHYVDGVPTKW